MMTIGELKELLNSYNDDDQVVVAHHRQNYCQTIDALEPFLDENYLCGEDLSQLTDNESKAEEESPTSYAQRVITFNF